MVTLVPSFGDILQVRFSKRSLFTLGASLAVNACSAGGSDGVPTTPPPPIAVSPPPPVIQPLSFISVSATVANTMTVPTGYTANKLIAWGDPLFTGVSVTFDRSLLTRKDAEERFGVSNDMIAIFPGTFIYPGLSLTMDSLILCVNNEFVDTSAQLGSLASIPSEVAKRRDMLIASMGVSIVRIEQDPATRAWAPKLEAKAASATNRRITPFSAVDFDEPVRSHPWINLAGDAFNRAHGDPGARGISCGTLANCAGGQTPWGTYLTAEENFPTYVSSSGPPLGPLSPALLQDASVFGYNLSGGSTNPLLAAPFDLTNNPTGATLYGWIVEIDPYDPTWRPRKRTSLGRRTAECATCVLSRLDRAVVYSADDKVNEFLYKFISDGTFLPTNRIANRELLGGGKLFVARFETDGTGRWIELDLNGAQVAEPNLSLKLIDRAHLLIRARVAARLLGATPMDRPEDIEAVKGLDFRATGKVIVALTTSSSIKASTPANPRRPLAGSTTAYNPTGHLLEINEANGDAASLTFAWDVLVLAGDPVARDPITTLANGQTVNLSVWDGGTQTFQGDRFSQPDNLALDGAGNLFIATDGSAGVFADCNDQLLAVPLEGAKPRTVKRFLVGPRGAEVTGPAFTSDRKSLFCSVQHPSQAGFPDAATTYPRSSVMVITKTDGGFIGS